MKRSGRNALAVGIVAWLGLAACYWFRPDSCALLTTYPTWTWPIFGALASLVILLGNRRAAFVTLAMSVLFFLVISEEPRSLARGLLHPESEVEQPGHLRVMSINCAGGDPKAAEEAIAFSPDIVLLQESPSKAETAKLSKKLYGDKGSYVWNLDCAVVADGKVDEVPFSKRSSFFTTTRVTTRAGEVIGVVCIHLTVPPYDFNPFLPSHWKSQPQHRRLQTVEMQAVHESIGQIAVGAPVIVGGDFNAPAGDPAIGLLSPRFKDAFRTAGIGWGNTIINTIPIHRIDQIWVSDAFKPMRVEAVKSINSDHRKVVCHLVLRPVH